MSRYVYFNFIFLLLPFFVLSQKQVLAINTLKKAIVIQPAQGTSCMLIVNNSIYYGEYIEFTGLFKSDKKITISDSSLAFISSLTYERLEKEEPDFLKREYTCDYTSALKFIFVNYVNQKSFNIFNADVCNGKFLVKLYAAMEFIKSLK